MHEAAEQLDRRYFAAAPEGTKPRLWRDEELATLRQVFPAGGIRAALQALPGRERSAIFAKAAKLGLRAPRTRSGVVAGQVYQSSEIIDAEIRRLYESPPKPAQVNALARRLMRPRAWISRRATRLGLATPRLKQPEWSAAELEVLERNSHKSARQIQRMLERAGYHRTENAITIRLYRGGVDRINPDQWTGTQLAKLMGVSSNTVSRWVRNEGLQARRKGSEHRFDAWIIQRKPLRRWIRAHAQCIDLRKVERYWFLELAFGATNATSNLALDD